MSLKKDWCVERQWFYYLRKGLRTGNFLDTHHVTIRPVENFLQLSELQKVTKNRYFTQIFASKIEYWVIIKFDKWPSYDVMQHKSGLVHHETMLSISFERYDPKQTSQCICSDAQQPKNFLSSLKEASLFHWKTIFLRAIQAGFGI